jgi:hypothetical protein
MNFKDFLKDDSFSDPGDDPPSDKNNKPKKIISSDEDNSLDKSSEKDNSLENDNSSGKDKSSEKEEKEEDKRRNEVRKQFTKEFPKITAKFIPPTINFKGNIQKKEIIEEIDFGDKFVSNLTLFKKYILITVANELHFYTYSLSLIYQHKFVDDEEEVLSLTNYNDETLIMGTTNRVIIINFYEHENNKINYEMIQEFKYAEFYAVNEKLSNGLLLLGGMDRNYGFFELYYKNEKISQKNKFQTKFNIHKVHNVYDDDCPGIVDLNNGRLFSWLIDDKNIKIIDYESKKPGIIKSMNGYGIHNAGLLCDKYLLLMGLTYPKYYSWLMDTETYEIVYKWNTPQNDSFMCCLSENIFLYGSETRIGCDEFKVENGKFIRKKIFETNFTGKHTKNDWEESFGIKYFLDENTFAASNMAGRLMIFHCGE